MTDVLNVSASAARGALLGVAVGDALGWPQELRGGLVGGQRARDHIESRPRFIPWTRQGGHYTSKYPDQVDAGEYSDDTQLMLAVARSCLIGRDWYDHLTHVELAAWPLYQRGGGGAVLSAAGSWANDGIGPWVDDGSARRSKLVKRYFGAGANGVAMRIAPHVICGRSEREIVERVVRDGLATHGHPRALVGALVYAAALRKAFGSSSALEFGELLDAGLEGLVPVDRMLAYAPPGWLSDNAIQGYAVDWAKTNQEVTELLETASASMRRGALSNAETTLGELGCVNPAICGAGTVTAVGAIYVASRFAARPVSGLLTAAFLRKGDTDTLASMSAALLGAIHGTQWFEGLSEDVQDAEYINRIASQLTSGSTVSRIAPPELGIKRTSQAWRRSILDARPGQHGTFVDGREYTVESKQQLDATHQRVRIRLADGQTALHDARSTVATAKRSTPGTTNAPTLEEAAHDDTLPASSAPYEASVVAVTAFTPDLARAVSFYAKLLGRDIVVRGNEARVTTWFHLRESASASHMDASGITVQVTDLRAVARRLNISPAEDGAHVQTLRDPDGRYVRIEVGSSM